jgi:hypothetical protein
MMQTSDDRGDRASAATITRDATWVEREYGTEKWPRMLQGLEALQQVEAEPLSLARVVGSLTRLELEIGGAATRLEDFVADGHRVQFPACSALAAEQSLVVESVLSAVTPRTQAILETGSGWGHNLFRLWLEGGPADVRYVAAEYTEAGRKVAERIGALEPQMRLEARAFDYGHPEHFSLGELTEAVVFSVNSVEQIPYLSREVIDTLSGLADHVRCFHFEPVGWQVNPDSSSSSQEYAERHDYNRNLVSVLREAAAEGRISLEDPHTEVLGVNPDNATTVLAWSSDVGAA